MNITQRDVASNELKTVVCAIPQAWGRGGGGNDFDVGPQADPTLWQDPLSPP